MQFYLISSRTGDTTYTFARQLVFFFLTKNEDNNKKGKTEGKIKECERGKKIVYDIREDPFSIIVNGSVENNVENEVSPSTRNSRVHSGEFNDFGTASCVRVSL